MGKLRRLVTVQSERISGKEVSTNRRFNDVSTYSSVCNNVSYLITCWSPAFASLPMRCGKVSGTSFGDVRKGWGIMRKQRLCF